MRTAPSWKPLDYFQPGCGIPAGVIAGLAEGNPVPGSELGCSAEVPSNPGSSPGRETRLGDAEESSHPCFCEEQSAWIMSVCSCQGCSGREAFVWSAGGIVCRRDVITQGLGNAGGIAAMPHWEGITHPA